MRRENEVDFDEEEEYDSNISDSYERILMLLVYATKEDREFSNKFLNRGGLGLIIKELSSSEILGDFNDSAKESTTGSIITLYFSILYNITCKESSTNQVKQQFQKFQVFNEVKCYAKSTYVSFHFLKSGKVKRNEICM